MKFYNAAICCSCDSLVEITASACPSCLDTSFFPLVSIIEPLDREELREATMKDDLVEFKAGDYAVFTGGTWLKRV